MNFIWKILREDNTWDKHHEALIILVALTEKRS